MKQKLFILSMDAMVREDVAYMMQKPNFARIMAKRAEVDKVCTVYPSMTYPAHTAIITGCRPGKNGIYVNSKIKPFKDGYVHWPLESRNVRVENLFAAAKRAGCTTASVFWPITACDPNIDHVINEYFFYLPDEDIEETFRRQGSDETALQAVRENMPRFRKSKRGKGRGPNLENTLDDFIMGCTCSLLRNAKPDVLALHNCYIDSTRHYYGAFAPEVYKALDQMDIWLGEVLQAMEDAGGYEDVNFIILSDHGQMDFDRYTRLNVLLKEGGFIDLAPDGSVYDWRAFCKGGMSAPVFLSDPNYEPLKKAVHEYLLELAKDPRWGIEQVFTVEETKEIYGTYGTFSFMVEGDGHTTFTDDWHGECSVPVEAIEGYRAKHGYRPEKGPQPIFLAAGPAFQPGAVVANAHVTDEAPTLAAVLGQTLPQADGRVLHELLA
ncbi:MAG: alkaline phosphatase family protein [Ruminococcaceae bacterium]|nr:alkaline phosphatase family protein [Oscillospiraceae bacterium]